MAAAVILIDLQKDFFRTEYKDQARAQKVEQKLRESTNQLLAAARKNHLPVFFIVTSLHQDGSNWNLRMKDIGSAICLKGTEGEALISGLKTEESDHVIAKQRYSAFFETNLNEILKTKSIDTLIFGGINTHACIRTSAVDAFMRDYRVFIPVECVASYDQEFHESSMRYFASRIALVLPLKEMIDRIEKSDLDFSFTE